MATITLTFDDARADRVIEALCTHGGYADDANPQRQRLAKPQFAKQVVRDIVLGIVRDVEAREAQRAAAQDARERVDSEIVIT